MGEKESDKSTFTCRSVGNYCGALSRGSFYQAVAIDLKKRQVRLRGDNGRTRWFPSYCFEPGKVEVPIVSKFELRDDLADAENTGIEVDITLSSGEMRWSYFSTLSALSKMGSLAEDAETGYSALPYLIVVKTLTEEKVGHILKELCDRDELDASTLPMHSQPRGLDWTDASIAALAQRFSLPSEPGWEDWPHAHADAARIGEFMAVYEDYQNDPEIRFTLMDLLLQSFEKVGEGLSDHPSWEDLLSWLERDFETQAYHVWHLSAFWLPDFDMGLNLSPFMREIWQRNRGRVTKAARWDQL